MNHSDQTNIAAEMQVIQGVEMDIPFSKLHVSAKNTRSKPHTQSDIECNAASILAYGLLNRLQVISEPVPGTDQEFGVIAGGGRYLSLAFLLKNGAITEDYPVKCVLRTEADAIAISLAENLHRAALHEADEFVAFQKMVEEGKAIETIAAHFNVPVKTVQQRLRLAGLHADLIGMYREGKLDKDMVRAFAVTTDKERQLQVWHSLSQWERYPHIIRSRLIKETVGTADAMAVFVGVDAYTQAGGQVTHDLFSQRDGDGQLEDVALLYQLAVEKLKDIAANIVASEGWSWSEVHESADHNLLSRFERATTHIRDLSDDEQQEVTTLRSTRDQLEAELDRLYGADDNGGDEGDQGDEGDDSEAVVVRGEEDAKVEARIEEVETEIQRIDNRLQQIEAGRKVFSEEVRAQGGIVVALDRQGSHTVVRGLIRRANDSADNGASAGGTIATGTSFPATPPKKERAEVSERLSLQLSSHRTAVMQAAMIDQPNVALAAVVHRLLGLVTGRHRFGDSDVVKITGAGSLFALTKNAPDLKGMRASDELHARIEAWRACVPADSKDEFTWLLSLSATELGELFSLCVALTLDATTGDASRQPGAELAAALRIDVADYWSATEASYLGSVSKDKIMAAVDDACGPGSSNGMDKMKKGEAAKHAEQKLAGTRWLPAMLRAPVTQ